MVSIIGAVVIGMTILSRVKKSADKVCYNCKKPGHIHIAKNRFSKGGGQYKPNKGKGKKGKGKGKGKGGKN